MKKKNKLSIQEIIGRVLGYIFFYGFIVLIILGIIIMIKQLILLL
jgi:hypothetical protein